MEKVSVNKNQQDQSRAVSDNLTQRKKGNNSAQEIVDNRAETATQLRIAEMINNSPYQAKQHRMGDVIRGVTQRQENKEEEELAEPVQRQENKTGLPDNLKSGMENLSGHSLDHVKVHYNSPKPAAVQAHAYAQGSDIHLASGQEKHLPHELGHVVQQAQGRVQPTMQMAGTEINDDAGLESEADVMGGKALQMQSNLVNENKNLGSNREPSGQSRHLYNKHPLIMRKINSSTPIIQGHFDVSATNFKNLVAEQETNQTTYNYTPAEYPGVTSVGFEHEFAQMDTGPIKGLTHLQISESTKKLPLADLPFYLETDADNALELVSPPFLVNTINDNTPIPKPSDVKKIDDIMQDRLSEMVSNSPKISELITSFASDPELTFPISQVDVEPENLSPTYDKSFNKDKTDVSNTALNNIVLKPSKKGGLTKPGIGTQVNFATNAGIYDQMLDMAEDETYEPQKAYASLQKKLEEIMDDILSTKNITSSGELKMFLRFMAKSLSSILALPSIKYTKEKKQSIFDETSTVPRNQAINKIATGSEKDKYEHEAGMASHVKDVSGAWIKDTLWNIGLGILSKQDWIYVKILTDNNNNFAKRVQTLKPDNGLFSKKAKIAYKSNFNTSLVNIAAAIVKTHQDSTNTVVKLAGGSLTDKASNYEGPDTPTDFLGHEEQWIGTRQDTYITDPENKVQMPSWNSRFHVVETRQGAIDQIERLKAHHEIINTTKTDDVIGQELHGINPTVVNANRPKYESWIKETDNTLKDSVITNMTDKEIADGINKSLSDMVKKLRGLLIKKRLIDEVDDNAISIELNTTLNRIEEVKIEYNLD